MPEQPYRPVCSVCERELAHPLMCNLDNTFEPVAMRVNRGHNAGISIIQINPDPGTFEMKNFAGRLNITSTFDGKAYHCNHDPVITQDMQGVKDLVRRWNKDMWTLFLGENR